MGESERVAGVGNTQSYNPDRLIFLGKGCAPIPERLLLAHAKGKVLFLTGAGISLPANLPDFRSLVLDTYKQIDIATHAVLEKIDPAACNAWEASDAHLGEKERAEVRRFIMRDYDVVLGMLERRMDGQGSRSSKVREAIASVLRRSEEKHASIHRSLMQLSDRGGSVAIATTNFDGLLERAARYSRIPVESYALGAIPRPSTQDEFTGIFHIHGMLDRDPSRLSDVVVTDHDFGEFYLRRRTIPDFIYDAARLYHLVLVGYSANDPPMRYLLNAVAADGTRFADFKERFSFVGGPEPSNTRELQDWLGRGITPVAYHNANGHAALAHTLEQWSKLFSNRGNSSGRDKILLKIVKRPRKETDDVDRDLFDHIIRRASPNERGLLTKQVSGAGADLGWLDAITEIAREAR